MTCQANKNQAQELKEEIERMQRPLEGPSMNMEQAERWWTKKLGGQDQADYIAKHFPNHAQTEGPKKDQATILWVPRSKNPTTGDIPQGYICATTEETKASCVGCSYAPKSWHKQDPTLPETDGGCYYWTGSASMAHGSMKRAHAKGKDYSLENALENSVRHAKALRIAPGGDPAAITRETLENVRATAAEFGIDTILNYTHHAEDRGAHLKGEVMASCDWDLDKAVRLIADGWRTTVSVPAEIGDMIDAGVPVKDLPRLELPDGTPITYCPNKTKSTIKSRGREFVIDCNECGWCDGAKKGPKAIGFIEHGLATKIKAPKKTVFSSMIA